MSAPPSILILAIGNDARGDDALAPRLVRMLEERSKTPGWAGQVELLEDYQLQVEHVTDLIGRSAVLFIDADVSCAEPYDFSELAAEKDGSYTTHAMTPAALLHAYRRVYGADAPPAFLLRIRGHDFGLGNPLSRRAAANLEGATRLVEKLCINADLCHWQGMVASLADKRVATE
ncbi:MAG TPA: hydrogenase maturation protease [Gallionellaceae bacterium]